MIARQEYVGQSLFCSTIYAIECRGIGCFILYICTKRKNLKTFFVFEFSICIFAGVIMAAESHVFAGIALIGVALVCAGLGIFLFFGCNAATKGAVMLTKVIALGIKKAFVGKEKI